MSPQRETTTTTAECEGRPRGRWRRLADETNRKAVLAAIVRLASREGGDCAATQDEIAAEAGTSRRAVSMALIALTTSGAVTCYREREGKFRPRRIHVPEGGES